MKSFFKSIGVYGLIGMAIFLGISFWSIVSNSVVSNVGVGGIFSSSFAELFTTAATTNVSATITPQNISLTVSPTTVPYGYVALNSTKSTTEVSSTITVTNNGNVTEDISGTSTDATGGATPWELAESAAANAYTHKFSINGGSSWTTFNVDNTTYATIESGLTSSATTPLDLQIGTPTVSAVYDAKTITISLQALGQ